jgi:hypothetical protein
VLSHRRCQPAGPSRARFRLQLQPNLIYLWYLQSEHCILQYYFLISLWIVQLLLPPIHLRRSHEILQGKPMEGSQCFTG